jgi:UDP-glucose 4-epimerase
MRGEKYMSVVVTGGAGFIGSHLVDALISSSVEVHVIDNLTSGRRERIPDRAIFHHEDITSRQARFIIADIRPDVVFHLAAQADVLRSVSDAKFDATVNIEGTINLLQGCCDGDVKKFILSSTSAVYGDLAKQVTNESDPTLPISGYGLSKLTAESYVRLFHRMYGISYTILRYANVYGPRQTVKGEGGVVAQFLSRIFKDEPIRIHGDGEQTRDFIYVQDVVAANLAAVQSGDQETLHISTASETSVNRLAEVLQGIHGEPIQMEQISGRSGDIRHSRLNNRKALGSLGWRPQYELLIGLLETYEDSKTTEEGLR